MRMKRHGILVYSSIGLFGLFCAFGVSVSPTLAAEAREALSAKSAPVAQKPPTAQMAPAARPNAQPRKSASDASAASKQAQVTVLASKTGKTKTQPQPVQGADEKLKSSLDVFAKDCIVRMNRQRRPGISQKEVIKLADGTFKARYLAVDPDSLATSYNPTSNNKTIKYIGRMDYHEVEYICTGSSQKQALAGPFNEANRMPITELIKYKNNKWTY